MLPLPTGFTQWGRNIPRNSTAGKLFCWTYSLVSRALLWEQQTNSKYPTLSNNIQHSFKIILVLYYHKTDLGNAVPIFCFCSVLIYVYKNWFSEAEKKLNAGGNSRCLWQQAVHLDSSFWRAVRAKSRLFCENEISLKIEKKNTLFVTAEWRTSCGISNLPLQKPSLLPARNWTKALQSRWERSIASMHFVFCLWTVSVAWKKDLFSHFTLSLWPAGVSSLVLWYSAGS